MSDTGDDYRAMHDHRARMRATYGKPCPKCLVLRPKANATILLPNQICKMHGYRDPRPELTDKQKGLE